MAMVRENTRKNFMVKNKLIIVKRPILSKGQKELYSLICEKLKTNDSIHYAEVKNIYIGYACQNVKDKIPLRYNYWHHQENGEWHGAYVPMEDWYLTMVVMQWFTHNIGCLVLKGYLKIIPTIELSDIGI